MDKSRKDKLSVRADAYAKRVSGEENLFKRVGLKQAFEEGYRAAMRDARKALATPTTYMGSKNEVYNIYKFLRPLR